MKNIIPIIILVICFLSTIHAQETHIMLNNPSFEDKPGGGRVPAGWFDCGMRGESPPDTQPGIFEVNHKAQNGSTFLGMVTRDNETWESVAQRLSTPIIGGNCYQFSIHLTYSEEYFSISRLSNDEVFFTKPISLRVWAGDSYCDKSELLTTSQLVSSSSWSEFQFIFQPKENHQFLVFEAYYKTPSLFPYNGNLLLDNASDIVLKDKCNHKNPTWNTKIMDREKEEEIIALNTPDKKPIPKKVKPKSVPKPKPIQKVEEEVAVKKPEPKPTENQPKIIEKLANPSEMKEGQKIRIEQLNFNINDYQISRKMYPTLNEIYSFMALNPKIIIEIGGHTNGAPSDKFANELSENRASTIANYLIEKGIDTSRIAVKGYGKTVPIDTNETIEGRKRNQRVEIKILSLKG